jgi:outer membrane lipoprotein SlyB
MTRSILISSLIALTMAGCAAGNPMSAPSGQAQFETKLLNLFSVGTQGASQVNYIPNNQLNLSGQAITTNTAAMFPIASAVGTGAALATNATAQTIVNTTVQNQNQNQLVL